MSSHDTAVIELPPLKKLKPEPSSVLFSAMNDGTSDATPSYTVGINLTDLTQEFVPAGVNSHEITANGFDSFFADVPLNIIPVNETSEVSSEEDKAPSDSNKQIQRPHLNQILSSAVTAESAQKQKSKATVDQKSTVDSNQKRQADRAARNRESSRRAREKAKNKFRALERENVNLKELVQALKIQNQHLMAQSERLRLMQQSCPMCKYANMAHQTHCNPTTHNVSLQ